MGTVVHAACFHTDCWSELYGTEIIILNNKTSCGADCTGFSFRHDDSIAHITAHCTEVFVFLYSGLLWHTTYRFCADERRLIVLNTKIDYLYRDASNYKVWNSCVISGELSSSNIDEIMETLVDGENFIPHLVGMPETRFGSWTEDDTDWFELYRSGFEPTNQPPTIDVSPDELVARFREAEKVWATF